MVDGETVYVGKTKHLQQRLAEHAKEKHFEICSNDYAVYYFECCNDAEMGGLEKLFINSFHPVLNIQDKYENKNSHITPPDVEWIKYTDNLPAITKSNGKPKDLLAQPLTYTLDDFFKNPNVTTICDDDGITWLQLSDVSRILEIGDAAKRIDDKDEIKTFTCNSRRGKKDVFFIAEPALYDLIFNGRTENCRIYFKHIIRTTLKGLGYQIIKGFYTQEAVMCLVEEVTRVLKKVEFLENDLLAMGKALKEKNDYAEAMLKDIKTMYDNVFSFYEKYGDLIEKGL